MPDEPQTDAPDALVSTDPVSDVQRERDDYLDRWLRKTAEFERLLEQDRPGTVDAMVRAGFLAPDHDLEPDAAPHVPADRASTAYRRLLRDLLAAGDGGPAHRPVVLRWAPQGRHRTQHRHMSAHRGRSGCLIKVHRPSTGR